MCVAIVFAPTARLPGSSTLVEFHAGFEACPGWRAIGSTQHVSHPLRVVERLISRRILGAWIRARIYGLASPQIMATNAARMMPTPMFLAMQRGSRSVPNQLLAALCIYPMRPAPRAALRVFAKRYPLCCQRFPGTCFCDHGLYNIASMSRWSSSSNASRTWGQRWLLHP